VVGDNVIEVGHCFFEVGVVLLSQLVQFLLQLAGELLTGLIVADKEIGVDVVGDGFKLL
jgi:hypothetical protein